MPYVFKPNKFHVKNPDGEGYIQTNVVAEQTTEEMIAAITAAATEKVTAVNDAGGVQVAAVQAKGVETLATIPNDYTTLSGDVTNLKSAINVIDAATISEKTLSGSEVVFERETASPLNEAVIEINPVQSGSGDPTPTNVRTISGNTEANLYVGAVESVADDTYNSDWETEAGTVYHGTLNVTTGVLKSDWVLRDISDFTVTAPNSQSAEPWNHRFKLMKWRQPAQGQATYDKAKGTRNFISDIFTIDGTRDYTMSGNPSGAELWVYDSTVSTAADFKEKYAGHYIAYEVGTAFVETYQLTATEVLAHLGENHVWADTGDVSVKYSVNNLDSVISDLAETTEKKINAITGCLSNITTASGYINQTGGITSPTAAAEVYTNKIPTKNGDVFNLSLEYGESHSMWVCYALYNDQETFISRTTFVDNITQKNYSGSITVANENAAYIALTYRTYSDVSYFSFLLKDAIANLEKTAVQAFSEATVSGSKIQAISDSLIRFTTLPGYINTSGGINEASSTNKEVYTNRIPVKNGDVFSIKMDYNTTHTMWLAYALYNAANVFISRIELVPQISKRTYNDTFTVNNADASYLALTYRTYDDVSTLLLLMDNSTPKLYQGINDLRLSAAPWRISPTVRSVNHRGYNTVAPENTLPAYALSKQMGFDAVECDIRYTADDPPVPVLLHDTSINRTARNADGTAISGTVNIADITYAEALEYDFGIWKSSAYAGTKIPTFEEMLKLCKRIGLHIYAELKGSSSAQIDQLLGLVKSTGMAKNVTWISFDMQTLSAIKTADPYARLGLLEEGTTVSDWLIGWAGDLKTEYNEVFIDYNSYNSATIEKCAAANVPLECWTINNKTTMLGLPDYVTGVTSDSLIFARELYLSGIEE